MFDAVDFCCACGWVLLPRGGNARQAGGGGVEISAFFRLMHYPLDCCFFLVPMGFGGVLRR